MPEKKQVSDQHARFLETARSLGCDEDEAAFDEKLRTVVKPSLLESNKPSGGSANTRKNDGKP